MEGHEREMEQLRDMCGEMIECVIMDRIASGSGKIKNLTKYYLIQCNILPFIFIAQASEIFFLFYFLKRMHIFKQHHIYTYCCL